MSHPTVLSHLMGVVTGMGHIQQNQNRLELLTARHWPEVTRIIDLHTATLLELLAEFGGPRTVAEQSKRAPELMPRIGERFLEPTKIEADCQC